ncbi:MAG TPA: hypothetical protein VKU00_32025 [Chthonomonadaceae bacterium]|nr:hypothetical protein [Chthonomonadaceae bacterium]
MTSGTGAKLTIQVHQEDRLSVKFHLTDPQAIQNLLSHLQPTKLFSQHHLALGGAHSLTVFPCARVVQVDFFGDNLPEFPHYRGVHTIKEITQAQMQERFKPENYAHVVPGETVTVYTEIELMDGKRHILEVNMEAPMRQPQEQNVLLQQILSGGGLHITRSDGGLTVLNPVQIVCITFYPGTGIMPPNAWIAEKA